jgi:hypothetical protein
MFVSVVCSGHLPLAMDLLLTGHEIVLGGLMLGIHDIKINSMINAIENRYMKYMPFQQNQDIPNFLIPIEQIIAFPGRSSDFPVVFGMLFAAAMNEQMLNNYLKDLSNNTKYTLPRSYEKILKELNDYAELLFEWKNNFEKSEVNESFLEWKKINSERHQK